MFRCRCVSNGRGVVPQTSSAMLTRIIDMPIEAIRPLSSTPRNGRNAVRSRMMPSTAFTAIAAAIAPTVADIGHGRVGDERADHHRLAFGEVDHAHHAEGQA